jgi:hypothetical protein
MHPLEILLENNPFYSSSAGNPWEDRYPDVTSINREAFEGVRRLVAHKAANPTDSCAGLVLGGAGAGKSHLLKRILLAAREMDNPAAFTYVRPILNSDAPMRYLLREIVVNLGKELDKEQTQTQLDLFAASILIDFLRNGQDPKRNAKILARLEKDPFLIYRTRIDAKKLAEAEKRAIRFLSGEIPGLSRELLRVIVKYRKFATRELVVDWLRGDVLDEEESRTLGVSTREERSASELEDEARSLLLSLGHLMARYGRPMIVCFDQLDSLPDTNAIRAMEGMVHLLVDQAAAMLPLVFVRADSWNNRFEKEMDPAVVGRLSSNRFRMEGCTLAQARELIRLRLDTFLVDEADAVFDWLWERLEGKLKEGYSPRQVIILANRAVSTSAPREESETPGGDGKGGKERAFTHLLEAYRNECEAVLADLDSWSQDKERLELALETHLDAHPRVEDPRRGKKKYISFVFHTTPEDGEKRPCMVMVNVGGGHARVRACLKRGIDFFEKHPDGVCCYISDGRTPIPPPPRWKATNDMRNTFEKKGGAVLLLEEEDLANWYALTSLVFKINEGDIQVEDEQGRLQPARKAELREVLAFGLRENELPELLPLRDGREGDEEKRKDPHPGTPPKKTSDEKLASAVATRLQDSPMKMLTVSVLLEKMQNDKFNVDHARLLSFLGQNKKRFRLFENKQGMTVMLTTPR